MIFERGERKLQNNIELDLKTKLIESGTTQTEVFTYSESKTVSDDIRGCGNDWWLRSPGKRQNEAVYILGRSANLMGNEVDHSMGVRPVIRVRYDEPP